MLRPASVLGDRVPVATGPPFVAPASRRFDFPDHSANTCRCLTSDTAFRGGSFDRRLFPVLRFSPGERLYGAAEILRVSIFFARAFAICMPRMPFERMAVHRAGFTSAGSSVMQKRCDAGCSWSADRAGKFSLEACAHMAARDAASSGRGAG